MVKRRIRQASLSCGLLLMMLYGAAPSGALDLSSHSLIYLEDFDGETSFPTTPQVNLLSIGANSSVGVNGNNNSFAAPFISGDAVDGHALGGRKAKLQAERKAETDESGRSTEEPKALFA